MIDGTGALEALSTSCRAIALETSERGIVEATADALRDMGQLALSQATSPAVPPTDEHAIGFVITITGDRFTTTATTPDGTRTRLRGDGTAVLRQLETMGAAPGVGRSVPEQALLRSPALAPVLGQTTGIEVFLAPLQLGSGVGGAVGVALPRGRGRAPRTLAALMSTGVDMVGVVASASLSRVRTPPWHDEVVRHLSDIVVILSEDGVIRAVTPNAAVQLGYDSSVIGEPFMTLIDPAGAMSLLTALGDPTRGSVTHLEMPVRHGTGYEVHVEATLSQSLQLGDTTGVVLTMREVGARRDLEDALTQRSLFDTLTGLPNRTHLRETMAEVAKSHPSTGSVALLLIDLDDFKAVNDSFGHVAGDDLLREVAVRLSATAGPDWMVARLGGDEFGLFTHSTDDIDVDGLVTTLSAVMDKAFELREGRVRVSAGVGAFVTEAGTDPRTMLLNADLAAWTAKHRARTGPALRMSMYTEQMTRLRAHQAKLRATLRDAVDRNEFELHYQQEIGLTEAGELVFEALLRWNHPDGEQVSPVNFIPLAEDLGLMPQIGQWVLRRACVDGVAFVERFGPVRIAVNVSATQLAEPDFLALLTDALDTSGFPPELLILEMTESVVAENPRATARLLNKIRALGILIAIDDFGTGYSSLSYLQDLPVDLLKIDRAFVARLDGDDPQSSLVAAVTRIANSLGLRTVAEGVETAEQLMHVRELGVDLAQGFYHGRPAPLAAQLIRVGELRPGLLAGGHDHPEPVSTAWSTPA